MADTKIAGRMKVANLTRQFNNMTVHIFDGDNIADSSAILRETRDVAPEGYLTGDEFEHRCIANITKFYNEKGLL